jgi:hypothetical protein
MRFPKEGLLFTHMDKTGTPRAEYVRAFNVVEWNIYILKSISLASTWLMKNVPKNRGYYFKKRLSTFNPRATRDLEKYLRHSCEYWMMTKEVKIEENDNIFTW